MNLIKYIGKRLTEKSTWLGIMAIASAAGYQFTDLQADDAVTIASGLMGIVNMIFPDKTVKG